MATRPDAAGCMARLRRTPVPGANDTAPLLMLMLSTEWKNTVKNLFSSHVVAFCISLLIDLLALMFFESMDANAHLFYCRFRNRVDGGWVDALFLLILAEHL